MVLVRKRGGVYHADFRYRCPRIGRSKRFRRTIGTPNKKEAERIARQWLYELENPPEPSTQKKRAAFSGFAWHWLELHVQLNCKPSYYRSTERELRTHLVPYFGDRDVRDIDPELIEAYKAEKAKSLSAKTVNNHRGVLSSLFTKAVAWGYADINPVLAVSPLKLPPRDFRFWDAEQAEAFLAALLDKEPQWYPLFLTAVRTGLRQGELLALRWDDLDFVKRQILVRQNFVEGQVTTPKSGKQRVVPMTPQLAQVLRDARHLRGELVFCRDDGTHLSGHCLWKPMKRATQAAGLPKIAFHDLRHSFASQLVMAGVPVKAVQEYLGHSDLATTMRYAHLSPTAHQGYVDVLDRDAEKDGRWSQSGHNGPILEEVTETA